MSTDERLLTEGLDHLADVIDMAPGAVAADLARGRRTLRRRRVAWAGGSGLAAVAIIGGGFAIAPHLGASNHGSNGSPFVGPGGSILQQSQHHADGSKLVITKGKQTTTAPPVIDTPEQEFNRDLYQTVMTVLDPAKDYLLHDAYPDFNGGTMSSGPDGFASMGMKLGWKQANDSGEGMVMVTMAKTQGDADPCGEWTGTTCHAVTLPGGRTAFVGQGGPRGAFEVEYVRADGQTVSVVVDPLFGNNSLTPTEAPMPTLDRVLALVQSPDLPLVP